MDPFARPLLHGCKRVQLGPFCTAGPFCTTVYDESDCCFSYKLNIVGSIIDTVLGDCMTEMKENQKNVNEKSVNEKTFIFVSFNLTSTGE